jgi:hypothetical protein
MGAASPETNRGSAGAPTDGDGSGSGSCGLVRGASRLSAHVARFLGWPGEAAPRLGARAAPR